MRMEQRQLLTPRMIQSMEILQLPLMALEERIEQEMEINPTLEFRDGELDADAIQAPADPDRQDDRTEGEQALVVKENNDADDFDRLNKISEYFENEEFATNTGTSFRQTAYDGERDKKLDAMNNTAARGITLTEHLLNQWAFIEAPPTVKQAGEAIITNIDPEGYLRIDLETLQRESKKPLTIDDLTKALEFVQTLEPAGVGARNMRESLLLQIDALEEDEEQSEGHDFDLERTLVRDHLKDMEMNRYPQIAKKLNRTIEEIKHGINGFKHLHLHPGKQIGFHESPGITPDAIIYYDEDTDKYEIQMTHDPAPNLYIVSGRMIPQDAQGSHVQQEATREYIANNVRNARWLIESIEQRRSTIQRVIRAVVDAQRDFFDKGPEFLKPLPMILVADQLGIHVATVSRAVGGLKGFLKPPAASSPSAASSPAAPPTPKAKTCPGMPSRKSSKPSSPRKTRTIL